MSVLRVLSRRQLLVASASTAAAVARPLSGLLDAQTTSDEGQLLASVPLEDPYRRAPTSPFATTIGSGLDARLLTDLSTLTRDTLVVPSDRFFVRTACPAAIARTRRWTVRVGGLVRRPSVIDLPSLERLAGARGTHLLECAGNNDPSNFGLLSAAEWGGVPMTALLERAGPFARSLRVLVSGVDDMKQTPRTSIPGASWMFSQDDLQTAGAFLATRLNGGPLPRDHGFPVRLVVPGWYGCAAIKWVDRIDIVPADALPTSQMREFAARTHQVGNLELARDFAPAVIDTAAMPIRVEKRLRGGRLVYRIVGIIWGGSQPTNALEIRFRQNQPWVGVDDCPLPPTMRTWSLWSHWWRPPEPGRYDIALRVGDPRIRTRRLDVYFYVRSVRIEEV